MRFGTETIRDRSRPNEPCRVDLGDLARQDAHSDPHRFHGKMHQIFALRVGMQARRGIETGTNHFKADRRRKKNTERLVRISPKIPWLFVDREGEMCGMK